MNCRTMLQMKVIASLLTLSAGTSALAQQRSTSNDREIVVTGTREQQAALEELTPERSIDEAGVAAYGASTIGEVLEEIAAESGDTDQPLLFVNGRPITDPGDIVDYPAEAIERVDVLPRGAGARLGAAPHKRAYNIVLKRVFKSQMGTVRSQFATEGGWRSIGAELNVSRISGQKRLNLTLRIRDENELLESDRGIVQPDTRFPFDLIGNVIADPRSGLVEIDPALSMAAGQLVTLAAIQAGITTPSLSDFAATAGLANATNLGQFRTLRPAQRNYEATVNLNRPMTDWLSASLNGRIDFNRYDSLQGLRAALFVLPPQSSFSPFSQPVAIARYFEDDPLRSQTRYLRGNLGLSLNATRGKWQATLRGDYRYSRFTSHSRRQLQSATSPILLEVENDLSPFGLGLAELVPLYGDDSLSRTQENQIQLSATGPVLALPAGPLRLNFSSGWRGVNQNSSTENPFFLSHRSTNRDEISAQGSLEIPLTSRETEFLGKLGDLSFILDYGVTDVGDLGTTRREGYALNWRPFPALHLQGAINRQSSVPDAQQLGDAVTVTDGVRYFDVLRGETVDVTQIYGGNPSLRGERLVTKRLSATAQLLPENALQLNAEFLSTRLRDPISSLPPTSAELIAAFPDRFLRNAEGRLVTVDIRPINFVRRASEQVRWGLNFAIPLAPLPPPGTRQSLGASRLRLQGNVSHTINLMDEVLAREGLPVVDLLGGGAIGFGGGSTHHLFDASVSVSDREVGLRLNGNWRSASLLNVGSPDSPSPLRFSPIATFNLRAFADLKQVWPSEAWLKGTKVSVNVINLFSARQTVRDTTDATPLRYQRGYRDSLGRTVELEIRRPF